MNITKNKKLSFWLKERNIGVAVFVALMSYAFYVWIQRDFDKKEVLSEYQYSTGTISSYSIVSSSRSHSLTYKYIVDSIEYSRYLAPPSIKFTECERDISLCNDMLFWVIYSQKNPDKSLINLYANIFGVQNPEKPKDLMDFE